MEIAGWVPESPSRTAGALCLCLSSPSPPDNDRRAAVCAPLWERFENIASFDLGLCSWTGACNLGVTERPARVGAGVSVGTLPAHSGAGGTVSRLGQPDPGGQGRALHDADPPPPGQAGRWGRGGADRRTRKREGERGGEDSQETPSGSCRPLTLTRRRDRHQEWLGFVQLSQYFR